MTCPLLTVRLTICLTSGALEFRTCTVTAFTKEPVMITTWDLVFPFTGIPFAQSLNLHRWQQTYGALFVSGRFCALIQRFESISGTILPSKAWINPRFALTCFQVWTFSVV